MILAVILTSRLDTSEVVLASKGLYIHPSTEKVTSIRPLPSPIQL